MKIKKSLFCLPFHGPFQHAEVECSWPRKPLDIECTETVCFFHERFSCVSPPDTSSGIGTDRFRIRTESGSRREQSEMRKKA